jgi:DNA-binding transcriptional regulator YiaG
MRKGRPPSLDASDVRAIRRALAKHRRTRSPRQLAEIYGVSKSTVLAIEQRRAYKWVRR